MTIQQASLLRLDLLFAFLLLIAPLDGAQVKRPEARELLSRSPWTMQVQATMDDPADVPEISTEVPKSISQAGQPNVGTGNLNVNTRWDGQIGKNRMGRLATIPVMVRWDSAAIIRQALAERHEPGVDELNSAAVNNFVLTVTGLLPTHALKGTASIRNQSSSDDDAAQARGAEEVLEWFMGNSLILEKGSPALRPQNVRVDAETGTVHLFFSRTDKLLENKHDIQFVTRYGSMSVQARFRLKEMVVSGKPDL